MLIYSLVLIIIVMSIYDVDIKKRVKKKNRYFYTELLLLILIMGCQWRLGTDNLSYELEYEDIPTFSRLDVASLDLGGRKQPLWMICCALLLSITPSYVFFHVVHSIVVNSAVLFFIKANAKAPFTAILLYVLSFNYFLFNVEVEREALAVACFLWGVKYLKNMNGSNLLRYYALAVVAFLFHVSALFCFVVPVLVYFLRQSQHFFRTVLMIAILLAGFAWFSNNFMDMTVSGDVAEAVYAQGEHYYSGEKNFRHIFIACAFSALPILMVLYVCYRQKTFGGDFSEKVLVPCTVMLVVLYLCSAWFTGVLRMANYLVIPYYVFLSGWLVNQKGFKPYKMMVVFLMCISLGYRITRPEVYMGKDQMWYNRYIPYRSVLD